MTRSWWRPTCIIPPIWVYCGTVSDPGDGASGHGGRPATPTWASAVRSARRGKQRLTPLVERAEGTVKALVGKGVEEARAGATSPSATPDRPGRPAFAAGRADSSPGAPSSRTRAGSRRARRAGRWNWGLRSAGRGQYQFILHHKLLWKEDDVEVAVPMIEDPSAVPRSPGLSQGLGQARVERATRQGRRNRAAKIAGDGSIRRWSRRSTRWSIAVSRVRTHGTEGFAPWLRCRTCTAWGGSCDSRSRTPGTRRPPPDRRRRCPHFSL